MITYFQWLIEGWVLWEFIGEECFTVVTVFSHETRVQYLCCSIFRQGNKTILEEIVAFQFVLGISVYKTPRHITFGLTCGQVFVVILGLLK
jgi:hypothetical protein